MDIAQKMVGNGIVLVPAGRIEMTNADAFKDAILAAVAGADDKGAVVLDLSQVEYISSAGLRALMIGNKAAKPRGVSIGVAAMQPIVCEIFAISRFNAVFPCFDTVPACLDRLLMPA